MSHARKTSECCSTDPVISFSTSVSAWASRLAPSAALRRDERHCEWIYRRQLAYWRENTATSEHNEERDSSQPPVILGYNIHENEMGGACSIYGRNAWSYYASNYQTRHGSTSLLPKANNEHDPELFLSTFHPSISLTSILMLSSTPSPHPPFKCESENDSQECYKIFPWTVSGVNAELKTDVSETSCATVTMERVISETGF